MMEFQEFLLVLEGFGRKPGGNHKTIIKKTYILYKNYVFFLNDFFWNVFFNDFF